MISQVILHFEFQSYACQHGKHPYYTEWGWGSLCHVFWQNLYESSHSNGEGMPWSYVRLNIQTGSFAWILEGGRTKNLLQIPRGYILLIFLTLDVASVCLLNEKLF